MFTLISPLTSVMSEFKEKYLIIIKWIIVIYTWFYIFGICHDLLDLVITFRLILIWKICIVIINCKILIIIICIIIAYHLWFLIINMCIYGHTVCPYVHKLRMLLLKYYIRAGLLLNINATWEHMASFTYASLHVLNAGRLSPVD